MAIPLRAGLASKGKVLIVDDTPLNVEVLSEVLDADGYEIVVAADGETGLRLARREKPDLILLDLVLPGMLGIEVLEVLKQEQPETTVVLTTAYGSEETAIQAMRRGVNDYIINKRPFDADEVREVVRRALAESRLRRENARLQRELQHANGQLKEYSGYLENTVRELSAAYEKLQELDQVKASFLSMVSHELRHPITIVKGYLQILETNLGSQLAPESRRHMQIVDENLDHLARMIDDLLDLSRLDAGHLQVEIQTLRPSSFIKPALEAQEARAAEQGLTLESQSTERLPLVLADQSRTVQVLTNLLDNACKFTPPGGSIRLSARLLEHEIEFEIADTGVGIPAPELERIFDRFYQVKRGESSSRQGAGLGLAISRDLVRLMGGRIWARSILGQGSQFFFTLPLAPEASSP